DVDERGSGFTHALGAVRGVVVVTRDHPDPALLLDLEGHDLRRLLVPADHLQARSRGGIDEVGKQRLPRVLVGDRGEIFGTHRPSTGGRGQRHRYVQNRSAVHAFPLFDCLPWALPLRRRLGIASRSRRRLRPKMNAPRNNAGSGGINTASRRNLFWISSISRPCLLSILATSRSFSRSISAVRACRRRFSAASTLDKLTSLVVSSRSVRSRIV